MCRRERDTVNEIKLKRQQYNSCTLSSVYAADYLLQQVATFDDVEKLGRILGDIIVRADRVFNRFPPTGITNEGYSLRQAAEYRNLGFAVINDHTFSSESLDFDAIAQEIRNIIDIKEHIDLVATEAQQGILILLQESNINLIDLTEARVDPFAQIVLRKLNQQPRQGSVNKADLVGQLLEERNCAWTGSGHTVTFGRSGDAYYLFDPMGKFVFSEDKAPFLECVLQISAIRDADVAAVGVGLHQLELEFGHGQPVAKEAYLFSLIDDCFTQALKLDWDQKGRDFIGSKCPAVIQELRHFSSEACEESSAGLLKLASMIADSLVRAEERKDQKTLLVFERQRDPEVQLFIDRFLPQFTLAINNIKRLGLSL